MKASAQAQKAVNHILGREVINDETQVNPKNKGSNQTVSLRQNTKKTAVKTVVTKDYRLKKNRQLKLFEGLNGSKFENLDAFRKYALKWARENLLGKKYYHKEIKKEVVFNSNGITHCINRNSTNVKVELIFQAIELLKKSKFIRFEPDYKNRSEIKGVYKMSAETTIKKIKYDVEIILRESENGVVYYDHKAMKYKKVTSTVKGTSQSTVVKSNFKSSYERGKDKKKGLNSPKAVSKTVTTKKETVATVAVNKNSLAYKMAHKPTNVDCFKIENTEISNFLGKIERKQKESVKI